MPKKLTSGTPWRDKLEKALEPKIVEYSGVDAKRWGGRTVVISRPIDVDELIRDVPKGRLVTILQLRQKLAEQYGTETACPLCTGIFLRIAAEVAEEDLALGKKKITPYWRVIKNDGALNEKLPGGAAHQAALLKTEGHAIALATGKRAPRVADFEKRLVRW